MAYEELAASLAKKGKAPPKKKDSVEDDPAEAAADTDTVEEDTPDNEMSSYDDVEDSAASDLADMVGVEDKAAFSSALKDYVQACVSKAMKD